MRWAFLLALAPALASAGPSPGAAQELLVTPSPAASDPESVCGAIRSRPGVLSLAPLFARTERDYLTSQGRAALAHACKVHVSDSRFVEALRRWIKDTQLPASLEENVGFELHAEKYEQHQWGLNNRGEPQLLDFDDMTTIPIPGTVGEDLGVSRIAPSPPGTPRPRKVLVAVLDTGIDDRHPDLSSVMRRKPAECTALQAYRECKNAYQGCLRMAQLEPEGHRRDAAIANCERTYPCLERYGRVDSDQNGYPLDCVGWNVTAGVDSVSGLVGDGDTTDDLGHGTHTAGTIGAAVNRIGVRGVATNVELISIKVVKDSPISPVRPQDDRAPNPEASPVPPASRSVRMPGFVDTLAHGLLYALKEGAQVVNLSLAWPEAVDSRLMREMVALAKEKGVVLVSSAGNDSNESAVLPCNYADVICVAAHGPDGALTHFSNYGPGVDIAAPGFKILATWPTRLRPVAFTEGTGYELKNGTSMASPMIAGAMAHLLGTGLSKEEAFARLMVSARPHRPSALRPESMPTKFTRSGNADLAAALRAEPQPLILPPGKSIWAIAWDGRERDLPIRVRLKNAWASASKPVTVHARLILEGKPVRSASLVTTEWSFESWPAGEVRDLASRLKVENPRTLPQELLIEVRITGEELRERTVHFPIEIVIPVRATSNFTQATRIPVQAELPSIDESTVRTVTGFPASSTARHEYVLYRELETPEPTRENPSPKPELDIYLLSQEGAPAEAGTQAPYRVRARSKIPAVNGDLLFIQRLDFDENGSEDYLFMYRIGRKDYVPLPSPTGGTGATGPTGRSAPTGSPGATGSTGGTAPTGAAEAGGGNIPIFRFSYFDRDLRPLPLPFQEGPGSVRDFDNQITVVSERFQWLRVLEHDGVARRVPSWVGIGKRPPVEARGPYDPWNPEPPDVPVRRFYYLASDGLRSVPVPQRDLSFVETLSPTDEQQARGVVPVLLSKGEGYELEYFTGIVHGNRVISVKPLQMPDYRMLAGARQLLPILPLVPPASLAGSSGTPRPPLQGTAFSGLGIPGGQSTTFVSTDAAAHEISQSPIVRTDSVIRTLGAYSGSSRTAVYSETHYEIQFHLQAPAAETGAEPQQQIAMTSLRRYSYIPGLLFSRTLFPLAIDDGSRPGADRLPSLLIPEGMGTSHGTEVIVPLLSSDGQTLEGLLRPARFHLISGEGCNGLADPIESISAEGPATQFVFFCRSHFLRIPLVF